MDLQPSKPYSASCFSAQKIGIFALLLCLVIAAMVIRYPGLHWLVGYGPTDYYSFHPDDNRFVYSARDFYNPATKPYGYPLFMSVQLFVVRSLAQAASFTLNDIVALRSISLVYSLLGLLLSYIFLRHLRYSLFVSLVSSAFLAFSPLHIVVSHFGTADISAFFLFYLTLFAAWQYRTSNKKAWFYVMAVFAGLTMADKFFLPSLVPAVIIIINLPLQQMIKHGFIFTCILITSFFAAQLFNFNAADFAHLWHMLVNDNLIVKGGKSPPEQIIFYAWDIAACSGIVTFGLALLGGTLLLQKHFCAPADDANSSIWEIIKARLQSPYAVIVLPLLFHAFLIITAQVHFSRHILIFIPLACLLAATGLESMCLKLWLSGRFMQIACVMVVTAVLLLEFTNGIVTNRIYPDDIRRNLSGFLMENANLEAETYSRYTYLKHVSMITGILGKPLFITCNLEYERYLSASQGKPTFHVWGGKPRIDFYTSLLSGNADYSLVFDATRDKYSLEDLLAEAGWLPKIDTYAPDECRAYRKKG